MNELEWFECSDPGRMLRFLGEKLSKRKLRLFAIACCRQCSDQFPDKREINALRQAELYADGLLTEEDRNTTQTALDDLHYEDVDDVGERLLDSLFFERFDAHDALGCGDFIARHYEFQEGSFEGISREVEQEQAELLRKIVGNPFREPHFDSTWRTENMKGLAWRAYEDRSVEILPILYDVLLEAGCNSHAILNYCQTAKQIIKGHWILDLLLGRE